MALRNRLAGRTRRIAPACPGEVIVGRSRSTSSPWSTRDPARTSTTSGPASAVTTSWACTLGSWSAGNTSTGTCRNPDAPSPTARTPSAHTYTWPTWPWGVGTVPTGYGPDQERASALCPDADVRTRTSGRPDADARTPGRRRAPSAPHLWTCATRPTGGGLAGLVRRGGAGHRTRTARSATPARRRRQLPVSAGSRPRRPARVVPPPSRPGRGCPHRASRRCSPRGSSPWTR